MSPKRETRQQQLPFEAPKERARLERVQRIMSIDPKRIQTAARYFTEAEFVRATQIAKGASNG